MKRKLKLSVDDLAIDSFDTTRHAGRNGTVFGEQCTCYTQCTCPGPSYGGCEPSLGDTCQNSCVGSCPCGTFDSECDCLGTCFETACGGSPCCR